MSAAGELLEEMKQVVDTEVFRPALEEALCYGDGAKGGRLPYGPISMFKCLVLTAPNNSNSRPLSSQNAFSMSRTERPRT